MARARTRSAEGQFLVSHGGKSHAAYSPWCRMKSRCGNPKNNRYSYYGGRGIKVCDRWADDFAAFLADMGERPSPKHSLDRINADGHYEPGNVRWATVSEQARNKRNTKLEAHEPEQIRWLVSEGYTQTEIGRHFGISQSLVSLIALNKSWSAGAV